MTDKEFEDFTNDNVKMKKTLKKLYKNYKEIINKIIVYNLIQMQFMTLMINYFDKINNK